MNSDNIDALREQIEGKRVVAVESDGEKLVLDDGTVLHLYMSGSDCCAYAYGEWVIQPDALDAIITDVKFDLVDGDEHDWGGTTNKATIAILHNQNPVALADCSANDGSSGYYYSVLSLSIETPTGAYVGMDVVSA